MDAECDATTPAISFDRFHSDFNMSTRLTQKCARNCSRIIINRRVKKESKTDMESATLKTLETTVTVSVAMFLASENRRKVTFLQQFWYPLIHLLGQPISNPGGECFAPCTHAHMHAGIHARMHVGTHACMHACSHACVHTCTHARRHACTHARMHACTHAHMHACTYARTHAPMHACAHAPMHACTHVGMHACMHAYA